ncbi:DapH/DapD/GlmU-related protein [uncultured Aquabacterium sp.]|uniref:DapH/DapD/GlmU-related protein n=1 Tax=Aquabacterium sp. TaxID=1872578 RepID=UPI0025D66013|nr:DapH/DapD/GlmU-related protein [uncultured Aquabacterium sp.]
MSRHQLNRQQIEDALRSLGIAYEARWGSDPIQVHFCSYFAQERNGFYFWEAQNAEHPVFAHADIIVLASREWPGSELIGDVILVEHPQAVYYMLMRHFLDEPASATPAIHPTAIIAPSASIGRNAVIGPYCVIEDDCVIGDQAKLDSHVVVKKGSVIGHRTHIESHSTIGATGVAWVWYEGQRIRQPQIGGAVVGDDCFLGTDITIVRGSINEVTSLGRGCVLAHGTKIGHGCRVGEDVHFANNVSIAGNCTIGDRAFLSAASVLRPRISLARGVVVGAGAVVTRNVNEEFVVVSGVPARRMDIKEHHAGVPRLSGAHPNR